MVDIEKVKSEERYEDFTYLDKPGLFTELFKDEDFDIVQLHDISLIELKDGSTVFFGFFGIFSWKDGVINSLDQDIYDDEYTVYGYERFTTEDGRKCIDILIGH